MARAVFFLFVIVLIMSLGFLVMSFAGDVVRGLGLMIDVIVSGKKTARAIYEKLTGKYLHLRSTEHHSIIYSYEREIGYEKIERQVMTASEVEARMNSLEALVEKSLTFDEA